MKGLWLEDRQLYFKNVPPAPQYDEALIKVNLAGICATDLELMHGYYPFTGVLGHEFVGEVVESPQDEWLGKRVVGEINVTCGECESCKNGRETHCEQRTVLGIVNRNGVFAKYTSLPVKNLHVVPDSVSDEAAVFVEPLAAALEIQQQVQIRPMDRVLVVGAGRLGQLIAQTLSLTGCDLHVVARHDHQKKLLVDRKISVLEESEIQPGRWDVVVEATGVPAGFAVARKAIRPRGTLVMKSTYKGDLSINFSSLVVDEITVVGSRCGPFEPALRLLQSGKVDPSPLIQAEFPLKQGIAAMNEASKAGMLKVLLRP
jgi:threonine dehydrogenase-like Zn-dependent dehydrogenase